MSGITTMCCNFLTEKSSLRYFSLSNKSGHANYRSLMLKLLTFQRLISANERQEIVVYVCRPVQIVPLDLSFAGNRPDFSHFKHWNLAIAPMSIFTSEWSQRRGRVDASLQRCRITQLAPTDSTRTDGRRHVGTRRRIISGMSALIVSFGRSVSLCTDNVQRQSANVDDV